MQGRACNLKKTNQKGLLEKVFERSLGADEEGSLVDNLRLETSRRKEQTAKGFNQGMCLVVLAGRSQCGWSRVNEAERSLGQR